MTTPADLLALAEAQAEIEKLRKALEWYADERSWRSETVDVDVCAIPIPLSSEAEMDRGRIARAALAPASQEAPEMKP